MEKKTRRQFIQKIAQWGIGAGLFSTGARILVGCERKPYDLAIINGMIYDGEGHEPLRADLGIRSNKITRIGKLESGECSNILDARGRAVTPGFIDVHTHTDLSLLINPKAESKIRQGVTLEIGGNCGDSVFPLAGSQAGQIRERWRTEYGIEAEWNDLEGFFNRLQKQGMALNYATLTGHGAIRNAVMDMDNRPPTAAELKTMKTMLQLSLEQGALGMSTGLEYTPGSFAKTEELIEMCKVVTWYEGVYATHMRNEDLTVEEALAEALQIARASQVSLQISHLKASQQRNWHKTDALLRSIEKARREEINVHADRYPYTAFSTSLRMIFPLWAREGTDEAFVARLQDETQFARMVPFVNDKISSLGSWASVLITRLSSPERRGYQGKTIEELATSAGADPLRFTRDLLIVEKGQVGMCGFGMDDEGTEKVLAFPYTMVGSDGDSLAPYGKLGEGVPHPRHYGTFPRYLGRYVREKKILPLAEAIRRITSMPADKFGLNGRGRLKTGYYADLVIFDPDTILDQATYAQPHQYPLGIDFVVVNGEVVVNKGEHSGHLPGHIIKG